MSRIATMIHLASGGTEQLGTDEATGGPALHSLLSEARAELQAHLKDVAEAVSLGAMEAQHNAADYCLHDTRTGTTYNVAWGPGKVDLLVMVSHKAALAALAAAASDSRAPDELGFQLDVAKTAAEFGCDAHQDTVVVLLPSGDGPNWDKQAIAPSSMTNHQAIEFANDASSRANELQAGIDAEEYENDGVSVSDRIDLYLEEAGFKVLSTDEGNLRMAQAWDRALEPRNDETSSPAP